ncbi:dephospho-CoA kinase [Geminocystis herdmanii]|uniref:dephospho-CoA kinase n=1 Tax=Geminocystis herdmanii TaxID=669359 RepID=UPI000349218A|nr:dephospho-CoA kinase [Geminocystis herdmanii]
MIIGLTGGIATGKSTVSNYLQEKYAIPVLDADIIARDAVKINSSIYYNIIDRYGENILLNDGNLNRNKLGNIIFNNYAEKIWLESKIHPFVRDSFERKIQELSNPIIILSIPLLFEANMTDLVDQIWVINCDFATQLDRLKSRNNLTQKQAVDRINSQMPLSEKVKKADIVIDNNHNLLELYDRIDEIMSIESNKN